ncbi:MAG: carboxypeptidase M32 [Lachnospiraceae bacterium]|nr:carboxypeptidase M32 [Lachnospiraceae bacterium]
MSETFRKLQPHLDKSRAYQTALTLLNFDSSTLAPKEAVSFTAQSIGILSGDAYASLINPEVKGLLAELSTEKEQAQLSFNEKAIVKELKKSFEDLELIPPEEYQAYQMLLAKAAPVWEEAKETNNYALYAPVLEEIIAYNKKFAGYKQKEGQKLYDVLLDQFEEGFTMEILDDFFGKLREALVPVVHEIRKKPDLISIECLRKTYDIETQKKLSRFMAEYIGFDFNRGVMAESAHPFTTNLHNHDVRITNHYYEDKLEDAIFSVIHEGGHGLYELGVSDEITLTPIGGGSSMGMHESQSRFYENCLGRSYEFWLPVFDKVKEFFPEQLNGVTVDEFYRAINYAAPSLIRTAADELTYSFHVMIRYEIEKMIFNGDVNVNDLPTIWNQKYEEYLGVRPENDAEGILQDMHWSGGMFGYFPSYALGSAIAAQLFHYMESQMPIKKYLSEGNLTPIREFLRENIHQYGAAKKTQQILKDTTGEEFNPDYYIEYLTDKYRKLYELTR